MEKPKNNKSTPLNTMGMGNPKLYIKFEKDKGIGNTSKDFHSPDSDKMYL